MTEATTKLPIKTEAKTATPAAPAAWTPLDNLRREIDRLFHNFNVAPQFPFARGFDFELPTFRSGSLDLMPAVDVLEKEKAYEITAELPGMEEKDIEVKLANGKLTIKGEKKEEKEERKKDYYLSERRFGSFVRSFQVPEGVDTTKIEASFAKGVLTVSLPKTAEAQQSEKTIAVKAA